MPTVIIDLDFEVIEKVLRTKVPAAVDDILRRYDLQRLIESAITSDEKPKQDRSMMFLFEELLSPRERFEKTLDAAISESLEAAATRWLKDNPEMLRPAIEKALPAALAQLKLRVETEDQDDD